MDRSATAFPADLLQPTVLDDDGNGGIPIGYRQHLLSEFHIILRVELLEGDALRGVKLASFRTIGTTGLSVHFDFQLNFLLDAGIGSGASQRR